METGNLMIDAQTAFAREQRKRRRERATRWLLRRPQPELPALGEVRVRRPVGLNAIPLDSIVGTAEAAKSRSFDGRFRPPASSRRRWEGIWMAGRRGAALPPISVYRLDGKHFVRDGHHRVSVAHALGMAAIDAEVTELGYSGSGKSSG
jgi:hypothetical protein